jgi:transposase-like protein
MRRCKTFARSLGTFGVLQSGPLMPLCPSCRQPATKRNGFDRRSRQKYACRPCRRSFTEDRVSAFSGYRWPKDSILTAVRWYLAYPRSAPSAHRLMSCSRHLLR